MTEGPDRWHRWLLGARFGDDACYRDKYLKETLYPERDAVLDNALLRPGDCLLDVGAGDGLIGFGALERLAPGGRVIFSDISQDMLDHCRRAAGAEGVLDRCDFVLAAADSLAGVADASVDVVTTRSVLIYVKDKAAAMSEFYRVLRPGGRMSLFEPINVLMAPADPDLFFGYDVIAVRALAAKIMALFESIQPRGSDPISDFDERDLVRQAHDAGFGEIGLNLRVGLKSRTDPVTWELFLRTSENPLLPTFGEAIDRALSPQEAAEFTRHLRPLMESGAGLERTAFAYLTAVKE